MIEFVKDWQAYRAGSVTDALGGGVADALKRRGIARDAVLTAPPTAVKPKPTAVKPKPTARTRSRR